MLPPPSPTLTVLSNDEIRIFVNGYGFPLNQPVRVQNGTQITLAFNAPSGYRLESATFSIGELTSQNSENGQYTLVFIMPNFNTEVTLVFEPASDTEPDPTPTPDPPRTRRHGIEFEQGFASHLSNLIPPAINDVEVEVLDFVRGIYRVTISTEHVTVDSRGTPFFFWQSMYGTFEEEIVDRVSYAGFIFRANPGTNNQEVSIIMGVGDGLGQVARRAVILKGNDEPQIVATFAELTVQAPYFIDLDVVNSIFSQLQSSTPRLRTAVVEEFSDVPLTFWAADAIYALAAQGVISGMGDGTFAPTSPTTVAQTLTLVINAAGITVPTGTQWYSGFMDYAHSLNLLPAGTEPNDEITRELAFHILYTILSSDEANNWNRIRNSNFERPMITFADSERYPVTPGYERSIEGLVRRGIVSGDGYGQLLPQGSLTRAQMAMIVFQAVTPSGATIENWSRERGAIRPNLIPNPELYFDRDLRIGVTHSISNAVGAKAFRFTAPDANYYSFVASDNFLITLFAIEEDGEGYTRFRTIATTVDSDNVEGQPGHTRVSTDIAQGQTIVVVITGAELQSVSITVSVSLTGISIEEIPPLEVGEQISITATVTPANAEVQDLIWESSNPSVATVESAGNLQAIVRGVSDGRTTITVINHYGQRASAGVVVGEEAQYIRPVRVDVHEIAGTHRAFGSRNGTHAGIDLVPLYNLGQGLSNPFPNIYAVADGIVIRYAYFYRGTYALEIEKNDGRIVRYCEIHAVEGITVGTRVYQGDVIARMGRMTGISEVMLHLEYFKGTATGGLTNPNNNSQYDYVTPMNFRRRRDLLDPTFFFHLP